MKLYKTKENEVYYYFLKSGEKRFMYRHKYVDVLGKRKEKKKSGFKTEKEALLSLLEIKANILNNGENFIENNQLTVSRWLDIWYETYHKGWKDKTIYDISSVIKLHFKPLLGTQKLAKLNYSTYKRLFINKLLDNFSPGTIRLYHKYFMMAINAAVRDEIIEENKLKTIKIKAEKNNKNDNFYSPEQLNTFLNYVKKIGNLTEQTLTFLLAYSGMRKGEALGLKWKDVCFKTNTITINKTRDNLGPRSPKSNLSYRTIEVDPLVIAKLKRYEKWCIEHKFTIGLQHDAEKDFVFISNSCEPVHENYINSFFDKLYKHFKSNDIKFKRITPHGLRHTHATILIDLLTPPGDVADRLGNTLEMILKVYAHQLKKQNTETVVNFGNRLKEIK